MADELQETYDSVSETQHVAEELALHSVISEERHDEILEETNRVCNRLDQLSQENSTANQSLQTALAAELTALAAELKAIKAELESLKQSRVTPPSSQSTPSPEPNNQSADADGHPEVRTEEPIPPSPAPHSEELPKEKKRRKI